MRRKMLFMALVLLALSGTTTLHARLHGRPRIDSLLKELPRQKNDTNKVGLLSTLSFGYENIAPDSGIKYGEECLALATELDFKIGISMACGALGVNYNAKSDYSKALEYFLKSLKAAEELGEKKRLTAATCNVGGLYLSQKEYSKALEYFLKALKLGEEGGYKQYLANITNNIGLIYEAKGDYPKALEYYFRALKLNEEGEYMQGVADVTMHIGEVYIKQKNYPLAVEYKQRAIKLCEELGDKYGLAGNFYDVGNIYISMINDTAAKEPALTISTAVPGSKHGPVISIPKGKTKLLNEAIKYVQKALLIAKEEEFLEVMQNCYALLSEAHVLRGDYKQAMECRSNYQVLKDSIFSAENDKSIMEQGVKYEYEKKEAVAKAISEKEIQKQRLIRNGFVGGFAVVLLFAGVFFGQRNKIKAGKKQSDELLLNILPAEVAEELKVKGSAEAKQIDEVTVLFTDFKGFTQLSEKLSPKDLVGEINMCFSAFDNIMHKHGVEKIKTIGDAYMAAGGLPTPNKTHAEDVVKAAMEIQAFMHRHKEEREAVGKLFFEIRIGVHTGPVVAGIVGIKKFAYDIWGDTVNTASRMESSGAVGMVNISQTTYELVKDKFNCEYRGEVEAKGKGVMKMYFVS